LTDFCLFGVVASLRGGDVFNARLRMLASRLSAPGSTSILSRSLLGFDPAIRLCALLGVAMLTLALNGFTLRT
jgi:hypothetical protein